MYLLLFARLLVVLGSINYLFLSTVDVDVFRYITNPVILRGVYLLIGLAAAFFLFNRDYYLPFLGESVIPLGPSKPLEHLTKIKITGVPPNSLVMAWGANESKEVFEDPFKAYGDYANHEIVKSNENGEAIVELVCPSEYYVNRFGISKKKLDRHIHYRYQLPKYKGIFSRIHTKYLDDKCQ